MHLLHSLRNAYILEEVWLLDDLDGLLQVDDALLQHAQFLETHGHVEVGDVSKVPVSFAVLNVHNF